MSCPKEQLCLHRHGHYILSSVPPHSQVSSPDPTVDGEGSQPLPTCMRNELSAIYKNPLGFRAAVTGWFRIIFGKVKPH